MFSISRKLFVFLSSLFLICSSCDCGDPVISQYPIIIVNPPNLVYPVIPLGESSTKQLEIRTEGLELTISEISIVTEQGGDAFSLLEKDKLQFPLKIGLDDVITLEVKYAPQQAGAAQGYIKIVSDARNADTEGVKKVLLLAGRLAGRLNANPNPVDFGLVPSGASKSEKVVVSNKGEASIKITAAEFQVDPVHQFKLTQAPAFPYDLEPGKSFELEIEFTPKVPQADTVLELRLDGDPEPFEIKVLGSMAVPYLEVEPLRIEYVNIPVGQSQTKSLTLRNKGTLAVQITALDFAEKSSPPFTFAKAPQLPLVIDPAQESVLDITFTAANEDSITGSLSIVSNDPNRPTIQVILQADPKGCRLTAAPARLIFTYNGEQPITLVNTGTALCELKSIVYSQDSSSTFSFASPPPEGQTLQPNASTNIEVKYKSQGNPVEKATVVIESNDGQDPKIQIPVMAQPPGAKECEISINPAALIYGYVPLGKSKSLHAILSNSGFGECILKSALIADTSRGFLLQTAVPPEGLKIPSGQNLKLEVSFTPMRKENVQSVMMLTTSDSANASINVPLSGFSGELCLEISPDPLDMGSIKKGCRTLDRQVSVANICSTRIQVSQVKWAAGTSNEFSLVSVPRFPQTLDAGQSFSVSVSYKPDDLGPDQTSLEFHNSAPGQSPISLVVIGQGVDTDERVDIFTQKDQAKIDVLFVIDDSNSMSDKQQSLSSNLNTFIQWATRLKADYRIAITTTDVDCDVGSKYTPASNGLCNRPNRPTIPRAGCFRGSPSVLTPQTPNILQVFAQNVKVGVDGSGQEAGIHASYLALQPNRITGCNKDFYRPNAALSIIYVSDEPDSSPEEVDFYVKFFLGLKNGRSEMIRASSVVGPPPNGCRVNGFNVKYAEDYWDIARQLRGVQESICSSNWATTLSQLGGLTFGLQRQFFLTQPAEPNSIQVKVNGQIVNQGNQGWTFDSQSNSITFDTSAVPEHGKQIEVRYKTRCLQ